MTSWMINPGAVGTPVATGLRREYYADVAGRYWGRPATEAEVDAGLAGDGVEKLDAFVVGWFDGQPAACGGFLRLDERRAELTRVFVRPAFRGRGGAQLLLAALEGVAREAGAREMVLNTRLDLVEARNLYVRQGYVEVPAYTSAPYAEICYAKRLAGSAG